MAACSETSFSPTRTARPSSERSYRYRWSCSSKSAALRTAVVDIERTLSSQVRDGRRELLDRERLGDDAVAVDVADVVRAGQHRDLQLRTFAPQLPQELEVVLGTDVYVEHDDVDVVTGEPLARLRQARR